MAVQFEWDESKERDNLRKHGVSFSRAIESFKDSAGIRLIDKGHSATETRYYWVGKDSSGRVLTTRFTERGDRIRIIGCGYWSKYRRYYNEANENEEHPD